MDLGGHSQAGEARNSSIELLKVLGIVFIVISHVSQTLEIVNEYIPYQDYMIDLSIATTDVQKIILTMLRYSGVLGNTIFFVCSAWFLLDSSRANKRKIIQILLDVWFVSIIILIITYFLRNGNMDTKLIVKQLFPTTFANNWYITCYILFYLIHPFLNWVIQKMDQRTMLRVTLVLVFLYVCCNFISEFFFSSSLILWITLYFVIAYVKFYLNNTFKNRQVNLLILMIGFIGNLGLIIITNLLGLKINYFENQLLRWNNNCNPFLFLMTLGLFNIFKGFRLNSKVINLISKLSLLIYIVHENMILRIYYRPMMWKYIYDNYGYDNILFWNFVLVLIVFIFAFLISLLYQQTFQRLVILIGNSLYSRLIRWYMWLENIILKIH